MMRCYFCNDISDKNVNNFHLQTPDGMKKNYFLHALVEIKSELLVCSVKLPLPVIKKGYDTPYLRRRMHLRGPYE